MNEGWPIVPLEHVLTPIERPVVPQSGTLYRQIGVRLWGVGAYERDAIDGSATQYKTLSRVEADNIIVNKIWARNGSVAVVPAKLAGTYASVEFPIFAPIPERLESRWMHWITKAKWFWEQCDEKSRGTSGKNRIRPEQFLQVTIPLPPLSEQQRIVARIEELAGKIERANQLRRKAIVECETLHNTVIKQVFSSFTSVEYVPLEAITDVRGGIQKGPHRAPGANPVRYLTVAHVQRNRILTDDPRYFEVNSEELLRWRLEYGDILIIEGNGSADQIGRTALFRGEIADCVHQNHVIRMRPNRNLIEPEFLNAYLNSPDGQKEIQTRSRTTSGLRTLSVGRIKAICIPLPSLAEQQRALALLDDIYNRMEALRTLQTRTQAELDALLPSILDRAFRGEL